MTPEHVCYLGLAFVFNVVAICFLWQDKRARKAFGPVAKPNEAKEDKVGIGVQAGSPLRRQLSFVNPPEQIDEDDDVPETQVVVEDEADSFQNFPMAVTDAYGGGDDIIDVADEGEDTQYYPEQGTSGPQVNPTVVSKCTPAPLVYRSEGARFTRDAHVKEHVTKANVPPTPASWGDLMAAALEPDDADTQVPADSQVPGNDEDEFIFLE